MNHLQRSLTLITILISSTQLHAMLGHLMKQSLCHLSKPLTGHSAQLHKALQTTKKLTEHQLYNVLDGYGRRRDQSDHPLYRYLIHNLSSNKEKCNFLAQGIASLQEAEKIEDAMHYKGYRWQVIRYNPTENIVHAQISGIADAPRFRFQASTPQAFTQAFHAAVDTYREQCNAVLTAG